MQTKRFIAADMSRALDLVRDEFGEDAMILSTQRTSKGVEIVATLEEIKIPEPRPASINKSSANYSQNQDSIIRQATEVISQVLGPLQVKLKTSWRQS
jgi:flagellar biosynthesis GTPase FlhF